MIASVPATPASAPNPGSVSLSNVSQLWAGMLG